MNTAVPRAKPQSRGTGQQRGPVARWSTTGDGRLILENEACRVVVWPEKGGAIESYVDRDSGFDIIWRNPYGQPSRLRMLDQPVAGGSDLYDVMDGSWYVSLPTGFFPASYLGAPIGTHGELRSLPWTVEGIRRGPDDVAVTLVGRSVRTPLVYRRELILRRGSPWLEWRETLENRSRLDLPVAWLQHPTFGGPLLDGAKLLVPARSVRVFKADDPTTLQLRAGYRGRWPFVPEREGGRRRDCSVVPAARSGIEHSVQLTDLEDGWGCVWNENKGLGFALAWDHTLFPYAWSWACGGGLATYPLWGEGHIITLQPSTSPVGRFDDLVRRGEVLRLGGGQSITTVMRTGFVTSPCNPWSASEKIS